MSGSMEAVDALETEAYATEDQDKKFQLLLQAAQKCLDLSKKDVDFKRMREKANKLLEQAEKLKAFSMGTMSKSLPSPGSASSRTRRENVKSNRKLPVSEQKLLWLSSLLNGQKFPPCTRTPGSEDFILKPSKLLFTDTYESSLSLNQQECFLGWLRPAEAFPPRLWFPDTQDMVPTMWSNKPIDLMQDITTDCSVVASLCSERARVAMGYPSIFSSVMFPYDNDKDCPKLSPNGRFLFRFNFNGCYRFVEIDDRIPVSKNQRILHIMDSNNPCLLWPALLEKAYLKVRGGYDFRGSNTSTDLWIITGWIPEILFLPETDSVTVWERILTHFHKGDLLISVGTGEMSKEVEEGLGLVSHHNYTILDLKEDGGRELVLVKNPWCKTQLWTDANFSSEEDFQTKTNHFKEQPLSRSPPTDDSPAPGTFWVTLNDLLQNFENLYLNWNPELFGFREEIHFEWDLTTAQKSHDGLARNPQFSLSSKHNGSVWLLLCRHFRRDVRTKDGGSPPKKPTFETTTSPLTDPPAYISLFAFKSGGKRVYNKTGALAYSPYLDSPQTLLRVELLKDTTYTIAISEQYLPAESHYFTLLAYTSNPIELDHAREAYAFSKSLEGEFDHHNSGGGPEWPSFSINPQWKLEVPKKTRLAILLESAEPDLMVNVKLCYSGKRLFVLKRRDTVLDSAEYGRGGTLAHTRSGDIDAGEYTIIASTFQPGQLGRFLLRVEGNSEMKVSQIPREDAGKLPLPLPPAVFQASATKIGIQLAPIRIATLNIIVKFDPTLYPRDARRLMDITATPGSGSSGHSIRSPLRISLQLGRGPESQELATSGEGEFSNATDYGLRIFDVNVWPSLVHNRGLFLVLERQGTSNEGSGERYSAKILVPATDGYAIQNGQWEVLED